MYHRFLRPTILRRLKDFPIVLLVGPRQCGKTTIMSDIAQHYDDCSSVTFDSLADQAAAFADPVGFINALQKPVFIDEVQRVPSVFLPIKMDVDQHRNQPGRYALTGSANPLLAPKLGDALTGRMALMQLWPLSQGELSGHHETFLENIFADDLGSIETIPCSREEVIEKMIAGGFPGALQAADPEARSAWCDSYLSLALQKDIQQLSQIEGLGYLPQLMQIIAARVGAVLNISGLASECQLPVTSCRRYLSLLQGLFLIHTVPAWSMNLGKRAVKAPKVYFVDTAILLHSLRFDKARLLENFAMVGKVAENFVINELCKQLSWNSKRIQLYHCRFSNNQTEIDLVLEDERGKIVGIEIKTSETVGPEDFKHFAKLEEATGKQFLRGIVLYAGDRKLPFGAKRWALPISSLWRPLGKPSLTKPA